MMNPETPMMVAKACEIFVEELTLRACYLRILLI